MNWRLLCCSFGAGRDRSLQSNDHEEQRTVSNKEASVQVQQDITDPHSQPEKQTTNQESRQQEIPDIATSTQVVASPKHGSEQLSHQHQTKDSQASPSKNRSAKKSPASSLADAENPPPYSRWQDEVPDTTTLPPPPAHGYLFSNTGNASAEDADRAHSFCYNSPLWVPVKPSPLVYSCVQRGDLRPVRPHEYNGELEVISNGRWRGSTKDRNKDCILLTSLPLYFAAQDSPLFTGGSKTIYFEVKPIKTYGGTVSETPGFAIGFAAQPYPSWRSPGWERGSVGVFSDDGCRHVNDSWGGHQFTTEFEAGETVGLGMTFSLANSPESNQGKLPPLAVEVFFTRNGGKFGGWDLHEAVDKESGGVEGLEGFFDLYGAIGLFGGVEFEACFDQSGWAWKGDS